MSTEDRILAREARDTPSPSGGEELRRLAAFLQSLERGTSITGALQCYATDTSTAASQTRDLAADLRSLLSRLEAAEREASTAIRERDEARALLVEVLARDGEFSSNRGDCDCINLSRAGEREYESMSCPHQRARALLGLSITDVHAAALSSKIAEQTASQSPKDRP